MDNARKKTSQLLHYAGMEVQDIFEDFQDAGPIPAEGDNAYKVAIRELDFYFRVEENIPYERHVFRQLSLQEGETADQFLSGNYATGGKPNQRSRDSDRRQSDNTNFVGDQNATDSENCAFPFAVTENQGKTCNATCLKESVLELNINGITTRVLIDSGSVSNLIGMEEYEELKAQGLNAKMEDCHKLLYAYGKRELEVIGHVKVEIPVGDKRIGSHLVVTKSGRCLLGHETSHALGLLRISSSVSSEFLECNVVRENVALVIQAKYPTVFVGVGKLKDYKLKLHVDSKGVPFVWDSEQETSFQELKQQLAKALVLAHFDKEAHTRVTADASPVGIGAVLVQEKNGVGRASRSLSSVERRYSQTEKEALALVWTCEWFNQYFYGSQTFDLVTNHEALKVIYSRGSKPSARIEGWVLRLQPYSYKVCCVASRDNIAEKCRYDNEHVRMVAFKAVPVAVKIQKIESASAEDEELQAVYNCLVSGNWEKGPRSFLMVRN
ncbi:Retrovirus-related Pol polyprotein [Stylophora pistillata]|uniref:Retrovirus-related Pol polyprotein n=1 Tax=Stylophora pistillata TaxID=50429 RepID=A0A2B4R817_STYPI|nr:Retrovirus-related Pol polyprotein [Stylophora pistillata]